MWPFQNRHFWDTAKERNAQTTTAAIIKTHLKKEAPKSTTSSYTWEDSRKSKLSLNKQEKEIAQGKVYAN